MNYKVTKLENKNIQIEITLNQAEWETEIENVYQKEKGKYNIEGFRKGKAPRKVIEKMYGKGVFYEDALSEGFYKYYTQILSKEKSIEPVDAPSLQVKSMDENGVTVLAEVVVRPEVTIKKYKGFKVKVEPENVTDEMVEAELKKAQEQNVRMVESKNAKAKKGNIVNIDFKGFIDGKAFEGGTAEGFDLELGSKSFIDNFEDQLVGSCVNEEKEVVVKFPKDYHVAELQEKPATFKVKINAIKEKQLPEINDEFASNITEFETVAEYKADIKKNLEKQAQEKAKVSLENGIIDKIIENMEVEVPHVMIHQELDNMMKDMEYRLMYQGLRLEDYAKYLGTTVEKLKHDRHDEAEKAVKVRLALQEIMDKEKITVTDAEVDEKLKAMAKEQKKTLKEVKAAVNEQRINYMKNEILINKLIDFLVSNN